MDEGLHKKIIIMIGIIREKVGTAACVEKLTASHLKLF